MISPPSEFDKGPEFKLPAPFLKGGMSLAEAIARRRSVRRYRKEALPLAHLSQILWAAQGITDAQGLRAAPSAGATYPLELFVFIGQNGVAGLDEGLHHYNVEGHSLYLSRKGDHRQQLAAAALGQKCITEAPVNIVVCAIYERTSGHYGKRAERYVPMEAGHVGQNISLQAVALGLASVMVGAFQDEDVRTVMALSRDCHPLYIIPVGEPR